MALIILKGHLTLLTMDLKYILSSNLLSNLFLTLSEISHVPFLNFTYSVLICILIFLRGFKKLVIV